MEEEDWASLQDIAVRLAELERQAEAARLPMLALLLEQARAEAESRLTGMQESQPTAKERSGFRRGGDPLQKPLRKRRSATDLP